MEGKKISYWNDDDEFNCSIPKAVDGVLDWVLHGKDETIDCVKWVANSDNFRAEIRPAHLGFKASVKFNKVRKTQWFSDMTSAQEWIESQFLEIDE